MEKRELRTFAKQQLAHLSTDEVAERSEKIVERILNSGFFQDASSIALYFSFQNEVQTYNLAAKALALNKKVYAPCFDSLNEEKEHLCALENINELTKNYCGILVPPHQKQQDKFNTVTSIDLFIIPGLLFDLRGARLGRGKGYFDRILKDFKGIKIALAYEIQIFENIPLEEWDQKIDYLCTENRLISCV